MASPPAARRIVDKKVAVVDTTDATSTASGISYTLPTDCSVFFEFVVVARELSTGETAAAKYVGTAKNVAGTCSIVDTQASLAFDDDASLSGVSSTGYIDGTALKSSVNGLASKTIEWQTHLTIYIN